MKKYFLFTACLLLTHNSTLRADDKLTWLDKTLIEVTKAYNTLESHKYCDQLCEDSYKKCEESIPHRAKVATKDIKNSRDRADALKKLMLELKQACLLERKTCLDAMGTDSTKNKNSLNNIPSSKNNSDDQSQIDDSKKFCSDKCDDAILKCLETTTDKDVCLPITQACENANNNKRNRVIVEKKVSLF